MSQLTTVDQIEAELRKVSDDQVDVISQMADARGYHEPLSVQDYRRLIMEEATLTLQSWGYDQPEDREAAEVYALNLFRIVMRINHD